jgi:hypothetical protein
MRFGPLVWHRLDGLDGFVWADPWGGLSWNLIGCKGWVRVCAFFVLTPFQITFINKIDYNILK